MATTEELKAYAAAAAQKNGVPVNMFLWQIGKESGWDPNAKNPLPGSTATGIAQFTAPTASDFNLNPLDPFASLDAAAKYDAQLYAKTGSWDSALTSYGTLAGADDQTKAAYQMALAQDGIKSDDDGIIGKITSGIKDVFNGSMFGLYSDTYKNLTGNGEKTSGSWDFTKYVGSGAFVILGIVVIVVAIMANKTVQQTVTTAAKAAVKV